MQGRVYLNVVCNHKFPEAIHMVAVVSEQTQDFTQHLAGIVSVVIFIIAYLFVITEEITRIRKSKPMVVASGVLWIIVAIAFNEFGLSFRVVPAIHQVFLEYSELLLFLLVAMTYVSVLEERGVFLVMKTIIIRRNLSYRALFLLTGSMAFVVSPIVDNLTTALVMCAIVLAVDRNSPQFVALSCINIVVAANAGGAFSPFGDITTLMVWQKGYVQFNEFFRLFLPSLVNWIVPAVIMVRFIPEGKPCSSVEIHRLKYGAVSVAVLLFITISLSVILHNFYHIPPVIGMMTGLGALQMFSYVTKIKQTDADVSFDVFKNIAGIEWDTLLFFYGVMMSIGALGALGYLGLVSKTLYINIGPTSANIIIGLLSAVLDNIPLMFAVLTAQPEMSLGQWLLVTLTAGVGGSLLSVGSAAGVALMGQAPGVYTFRRHLRWTWAVAIGYGASLLTHLAINYGTF